MPSFTIVPPTTTIICHIMFIHFFHPKKFSIKNFTNFKILNFRKNENLFLSQNCQNS